MHSPVNTKLSGVTGFILHEDENRVIIATLESRNEKTGDMVQVWILAAGQSPIATIQERMDSLICGDCKHMGDFGKRTCYVFVPQGPQQVWAAWARGSYQFLPKYRYIDVFGDRQVRLGAYGDPAFIPVDVLRAITFAAQGWTGYTHQWRNRQDLSPYLMASCDSETEHWDAKRAGWRTFRVRTATDRLMPKEIMCPASPEGGKKTHCVDCGLCNGSKCSDPRKDIAIIVHGVGAKNFIQIGKVA